jgi:acylphosphatase
MTARVTGRVQGVGFRWWARTRAQSLGLTGWIQNDPNERSVTLLAEGPPERLDELERLLRIGPSSARVEEVQASREPASGSFQRFEISPR